MSTIYNEMTDLLRLVESKEDSSDLIKKALRHLPGLSDTVQVVKGSGNRLAGLDVYMDAYMPEDHMDELHAYFEVTGNQVEVMTNWTPAGRYLSQKQKSRGKEEISSPRELAKVVKVWTRKLEKEVEGLAKKNKVEIA